jgi:hypothetical protein
MPRGKIFRGPAKKTSAPIRLAGIARRLKEQRDCSWFDHREMRARIAESEADIREGWTKRFDSPEAALVYLDGWL